MSLTLKTRPCTKYMAFIIVPMKIVEFRVQGEELKSSMEERA